MVLWAGRQRKYLITGWLWYLVTLVPVVGIVQVGSQAHADRYTYLPYISLFIMLAWGSAAFAEGMSRGRKMAVTMAATAVLILTSARTGEQVGFWKNGISLFSHTVEATKGNDLAHYMLANLLRDAGRPGEAIDHYRKSLEINPNKLNALVNLASVFVQTNQPAAAVPLLNRALALTKTAGNESLVRDTLFNLEVVNNAIARQNLRTRPERTHSAE